jgi:uncharacterized membrane protein YccC
MLRWSRWAVFSVLATGCVGCCLYSAAILKIQDAGTFAVAGLMFTGAACVARPWREGVAVFDEAAVNPTA